MEQPIMTYSHGLSPWELFINAGLVVKSVMLMLTAASIWSWSIIITKTVKLKSLYTDADYFESQFWSGDSLDDLYERLGKRPRDPMSSVFYAAMQEWRRSFLKNSTSQLKATMHQRIERVMSVTVNREMDNIEQRMSFLATVGSTATFVGLFGTVWGIVTSFNDIAAQNNTSLAVVAPGIAEALFATAIGLIVAIPAMVAYNKLSHEITRYGNRLDSFASEFGTIISRQLEEQA